MNVVVKHAQSLIDITLQITGSLEALFAIAIENGRSITDILQPGEVITVTPPDPLPEVASYIAKRKMIIAASADTETQLLEGIGYWYIENDFVVS